MKTVKWLLLNLHIWCVLLDITISVLGVPYVMFPSLAGFLFGVIDAPQFIFYVGITLLTGVSTSVFVIFENRYFVLFGQNSPWRYVRKLCIVASYILVPLYFLPPQFVIPDQDAAKEIILQTLPCIPELPVYNRKMFIATTDTFLLSVTIAIAETVPAVQCTIFFILNCYNLIFVSRINASRRTTQMQRKLLVALIVQISVTCILFLVPVNAIVLFVYTGYQNQIYNNFIIISFSFHGVFSTLIMIFAHKPYREFVVFPLYFVFRRPERTIVTTSDYIQKF